MTIESQQPLPTALAGAHPQVADAILQLQKFQATLEGTANQIGGQTFTATDEDETVEVTIDGQYVLTVLHIEDGLRRLGAEAVQQRINEALRNAEAEATAAIAAQNEQLFASLLDTVNELKTGMGLE